MNCKELLEEVAAYLDDELEPAVCRELEAHLEGCTSCCTELEELRRVDELLLGCPDHQLSPGFSASFRDKK